jgi:hypothetical protein
MLFIASGLLRDRRGNSTLDLDSWIGLGWRVNKCKFVNKLSRNLLTGLGFPSALLSLPVTDPAYSIYLKYWILTYIVARKELLSD